jgi:hypothetical protein
MPKFEEISAKQLIILSEILSESSLRQIEFIRTKYLRQSINFSETITFLQELGLLEVRSNEIVPKPKYAALFELIKKFIFHHLLIYKSPLTDYFDAFLSGFHLVNDRYEFTPSFSQRLEYSGVRNFLIGLGLLHIDSSETTYRIDESYPLIDVDFKTSSRMSPDEFLMVQRRREDIGRAAEFRILEYERTRLSKHPSLAEMVEHVAVENVTAGYDIRSYNDVLSENGSPIPRLIEVKAVSPWDYRFHWTRNEIETSRANRQNYYLYLLPVAGRNNFDIQGLRIIGDPYLNVYENKNEWIRAEELIAFALSQY